MNQKLYHCLMASLVSMGVAVAHPINTPTANDVNSGTNNIATGTPIKYIVVLYQENVSFDHYFATYPFASNPKGERPFNASHDTPRVNNLLSAGLLDRNPNSTQPFRIDPSTAVTCDQNHGYTAEQIAFDHGLMNKFPESTGQGNSAQYPCHDLGKGNGIVMGYFDGNTVTAIWNYAQHFAMSDNFFGTSFGPSTPGAINLVTGTTSGAVLAGGSASGYIANGAIAGWSSRMRSITSRRAASRSIPSTRRSRTIVRPATINSDICPAVALAKTRSTGSMSSRRWSTE